MSRLAKLKPNGMKINDFTFLNRAAPLASNSTTLIRGKRTSDFWELPRFWYENRGDFEAIEALNLICILLSTNVSRCFCLYVVGVNFWGINAFLKDHRAIVLLYPLLMAIFLLIFELNESYCNGLMVLFKELNPIKINVSNDSTLTQISCFWWVPLLRAPQYFDLVDHDGDWSGLQEGLLYHIIAQRKKFGLNFFF